MNTVVFRRQSINSVLSLTRSILRYSSQDVTIYDDPTKYKDVIKPSRIKKHRYFLKNPIERIFLGDFDCSLLEYPEFSCLKEVEYLNDFVSVIGNTLNNIKESEQEDSTKLTNYEYSRKLNLYGLKTPIDYCGFGFTEPECAYIYESLASNPSLLKIIHENEEFGVHLLSLFGTDEQKKKYMPKVINGEMMMCFAHFESFPILSNEPLKTLAYNSAQGESFTLVGKKLLVYNANIADLIIVSANTSSEGNENKQTFFLIDKNSSGIKISEPVDVIGLNNAGFSEITFDKVVVPQKCILGKLDEGENLFKQVLALGKMNIGMECSALMRNLATDAIKHGLHTNMFKKPLNEHYFMKRKLANLICDTYTVESLAYLVSGRLYEYKDPDVFLDSLIVKIFAAEAFQRSLENYLQLMNRDSYRENYQLREMLKTSAFHSVFDENNDNLKLLIASKGMEYVKKHRKPRLIKRAKFYKFKFDSTFMEQTAYAGRGGGVVDENVLTWYLHPSLEIFAKQTYTWIAKVDKIVEQIVTENKDGDFSNINYKLLKLVDMIVIIYANAAALGRASRSYCIGLRHAELEMKIAMAQNATFNRQIETLELELLKSGESEEKRTKNIGNRTIELGKYELSHPYLRQKISAKR